MNDSYGKMKSYYTYIEGMTLFRSIILSLHPKVSSKKVKKHSFNVFDPMAWQDGEKSENPTNPKKPRACAYLTAYLVLVDDTKLFARGIRFSDTNELSLDKGVMGGLLRHKLVNLEGRFFFLTEKGTNFLIANPKCAKYLKTIL